ncbi:unnamed protein product [Phytophthora lilii]|uniref:Unnamed protein product n=1 Tax=Phytophthora lilii TaxID=2077276 RepID=A0A9W6WZE0_9STRA|nr:unnamed protein product [Phytophthora lilii]
MKTRGAVSSSFLAAHTANMKQTQSRAASLINGERDFLKLYQDIDGPPEDSNVGAVNSGASYGDELMSAFKRKTQELCDETREQCEQRLERQEVQHERQVQSLQRQLRKVVGSCVSLTEHEQILATTASEQQRQLDEIRRHHQSKMRELEQRCEQKWQARSAAVKKQSEQEKSELLLQIDHLELQKNALVAEAKEHELSDLRWGEKLETANREKAAVEKQVEDAKKRLEDACRLIVALKTRLRHNARLARDLESQRDKTMETRDEVMKCKLAYAELKGDMDTRIASLERELDHALRSVADEKANACALQVLTS